MITSIKREETQLRPAEKYPKLMKSPDTGAVYLMERPKRGICVYSDGSGVKLGDIYSYLSEEDFEEYRGSITLEGGVR